MELLFIFLLALIALSSYACGYYFSFKERYKQWYNKLFTCRMRPTLWPISRMKNHNRYITSCRTLLITLVILLAIAILNIEEIVVPLWTAFLYLMSMLLIPYFVGKHLGKQICDKKIIRECKSHRLVIDPIWKKSPSLSWRFF